MMIIIKNKNYMKMDLIIIIQLIIIVIIIHGMEIIIFHHQT